ncbi:hypothetical protein NORO109296_11840 [Nocardiopsis rhodophaea]
MPPFGPSELHALKCLSRHKRHELPTIAGIATLMVHL